MIEFKIKVIKSDWSDDDSPVEGKVLAAHFDDGTKGFYFFDTRHNVRIWVTVNV
jgi:hypothetical protein